MSWEAKCERFYGLLKKALNEEPCLDLPVIEQKFGIDAQYDMLDSLVNDALLEENFPPLPVIDQKIVRWIDRLEELEEQQLKLVSDANVQQEPEREEEQTVQAVKVNKGHQSQLQPRKCDICGMEFQFPVNIRRHKWRHGHKTEEKTIVSTRDQFLDYWEKLEVEKAHMIVSITDAGLPANLAELQLNDILGAVSSYVESLDKESQLLEQNIVIAFLLGQNGAAECPPFPLMLKVLSLLSDGTLFRGTLEAEMQQIVFPHAISMAEIEEQGLLASFEFLVEYCMMKAWADDRKHIADLLLEEEEEARKQMQSTAFTSKARTSKASSSKRRKEKARKQKESNSSEQHREDKEHTTVNDEEYDSSSQMNQTDSKESQESMAEKSSEYHAEHVSSNEAATQLNPVLRLDDSVQVSTFSLPHQEMPTESMEAIKASDLLDHDIKDGDSLSRQSIASTSKASKLLSAQRKKRRHRKSKQMKKNTEVISSQDKEAHDSSLLSKERDSKQSEDDTRDQTPRFNKEEEAIAAATGDSVQDNMSSSLNQETTTESVEGVESGDLLGDAISDLVPPNSTPAFDDGGSLSGIPHPEKSEVGQGESETTDAGGASKGEEECRGSLSGIPHPEKSEGQGESKTTDAGGCLPFCFLC